MKKSKVNQADRIAKLEKVVSQLYIRQVQIYKMINPTTLEDKDEEE
tara:strand:+ start:358 stop:495 length:138 start_codon:yes stop_codon:yes gene_type:complete